MLIQNDACPWNVPVEVEVGRFASMLPEHRELNVRVVPHPVFGCIERPLASDELLFADLQTSQYTHIVGRLGSGRAGFYRGWYLKGVGRTPLATNWNTRDYLHNSGHMTPSSAIREYVVSRYLAGQGRTESIVACEGILLAELASELGSYHQLLYRNKPAESVPPVDRTLQAISIKRGGFARPSNFLWLLHHISPAAIAGGTTNMATMCGLLAAAVTPPGEPELREDELSADRLAALLARTVWRAADHFRAWFHHGVWWGSFTNNATIDGRFLDLETPVMLAGPCFGCLSSSKDDRAPERGVQSSLFGVELFSFLAQIQMFYREFVRVIGQLPLVFGTEERAFGAELAGEIERQVFAPDQLLGSRDVAIEWVRDMLVTAFDRLPASDDALVRTLLDRIYERELGDGIAQDELDRTKPPFLALPSHRRSVTEPGLQWRPFGFELSTGRLLEPSEAQSRTARVLADIIADLDHTTALPALLDKLASLARIDRIA